MTDRDQPTKNPPRPHKQALLWQSYCFYAEFRDMRTSHLLRISSKERGVSTIDTQFERDTIKRTGLDQLVANAEKVMVDNGSMAGPIWPWLRSIRGLKSGGLAAQLVAQIDDIGRYATVSKLWRFCGYAVVDGQIDRCTPGEKSKYNHRLKAIVFLIVDEFVKHQTSGYVDLYYAEKERQRALHPVTECGKCGCPWAECTEHAAHKGSIRFTDRHIDYRARRKVAKVFLQHLWVTWRQSEGLPVSEPYVQAILGHTHIVAPAPLPE